MRITLLMFVSLLMITHANAASKPTDDDYMRQLIKLAHQRPHAPFAAMIVDNQSGKILCEGLNDSKASPIYHGEMVAINRCAEQHPNMQWQQTTLYTTAEPCPMCASAIVWAGIPVIKFGTSIPTLQRLKWGQIAIRTQEVIDKAPFYRGKASGGILAKETDKLFTGVIT